MFKKNYTMLMNKQTSVDIRESNIYYDKDITCKSNFNSQLVKEG